MKAFVHKHGELQLTEIEAPIPAVGEVIVKIHYAGLNRRDLYIPARRAGETDALILGSDGAGIIESIGVDVTNFEVGDTVIINPALHWDKNTPAPPAEFDILGMPDHGTFAEFIVISAAQIEKKPAYLSWEEAAVTALAGLTGYRALITKGKLAKNETVFIPGAGSGVATFLISLAKSYGARVIVSSRSPEKRAQAIELGADLAVDTFADWKVALKDEQIDLVIDSVGRATFNRSLEVLKKGGRIVIFGATTEDTVDFDLRAFFYGQYQLIGSTMGSREELRALLVHMEKHQLHPVIDKIFELKDVKKAFKYLEDNQQFGKIALKII